MENNGAPQAVLLSLPYFIQGVACAWETKMYETIINTFPFIQRRNCKKCLAELALFPVNPSRGSALYPSGKTETVGPGWGRRMQLQLSPVKRQVGSPVLHISFSVTAFEIFLFILIFIILMLTCLRCIFLCIYPAWGLGSISWWFHWFRKIFSHYLYEYFFPAWFSFSSPSGTPITHMLDTYWYCPMDLGYCIFSLSVYKFG